MRDEPRRWLSTRTARMVMAAGLHTMMLLRVMMMAVVVAVMMMTTMTMPVVTMPMTAVVAVVGRERWRWHHRVDMLRVGMQGSVAVFIAATASTTVMPQTAAQPTWHATMTMTGGTSSATTTSTSTAAATVSPGMCNGTAPLAQVGNHLLRGVVASDVKQPAHQKSWGDARSDQYPCNVSWGHVGQTLRVQLRLVQVRRYPLHQRFLWHRLLLLHSVSHNSDVQKIQ
mmetsp:Transcript_96869/g.134483  ORF Transcript_96869/g.134483 Transcript_96869/m.134483 type:complete len:227 (+) Transcript_96869:941-1621(+)